MLAKLATTILVLGLTFAVSKGGAASLDGDLTSSDLRSQSGYGLGLGFGILNGTITFGKYMKGDMLFVAAGANLNFEAESQSYLTLNYRKFFGNSFYLTFGAGGYSWSHASSSDDDNDDADTHSGGILSFAIGNQWFVDENFTLGVDWLSADVGDTPAALAISITTLTAGWVF